jgi:hypothetical protein
MKHNPATTGSQPIPRGIIRDSKGVAFTTSGLPMADHFFQATSFMIKRVGSSLHMAFGAQSAFADPSDTEFKLAIEIVYPIEMAVRYLYKLNWEEKSAGSSEPFATILEKVTKKDLSNYEPPKTYKIPSGANFRNFPANFAIMSLSTGQGAIEFFEGPPGMLVEAFYQKTGWRPNSDVRAVLNVILPPVELYRFLVAIKETLKDIPIPNEDEKENEK